MDEPISLLIIDEYQVVRDALVERMSSFNQIDVVAAVACVHESLQFINGTKPDVILMELKGRREGGPDLITTMRHALEDRRAGIIVLTSYEDAWERESALKAGAHRYLLKEINSGNLVSEIEALAAELKLPRSSDGPQPTDSSLPMTDVMSGA